MASSAFDILEENETVAFVTEKKIRKNHHHIGLKGRYPIPLQTPFDQSNYQYVGSHTDLATAEMQMDDCPYRHVAVMRKESVMLRSEERLDRNGEIE